MRDNNIQVGGNKNRQEITNSASKKQSSLFSNLIWPTIATIIAGLILYYIFGI